MYSCMHKIILCCYNLLFLVGNQVTWQPLRNIKRLAKTEKRQRDNNKHSRIL